eukprot:scaffold1411_cov221-Alexandrium_tamarense.AAC.17
MNGQAESDCKEHQQPTVAPIRVNPNCPTGLQDRAFLIRRHLSIRRGKNDFITSSAYYDVC